MVSDRHPFPTWTKHWSSLGWDRAMKEATIPCSKHAGNFLRTKLRFYWRCELEHRPVGLWNLDFLSSLSYHTRQGPKYYWCTHLCWLYHPVSQKSEEISKFLTLQPKPWYMLASGGDKRLTYLQERPLSIGPALCRFVNWTLPPKWIFFSSKKRFHPSVCQISINSKEEQLSFVVKGQ